MVLESHYDKLRDAIFDDDVDRFQSLLETPIDIDHYDAGGQTLLHLASFWGRTSMVRMLLSAGASMRCKNAAGCTALDLATHWGHSSVAEVLRHRGASSVWEDKLGQLQIEVEDAQTKNVALSEQIAQHKLERVELQEEMMALYQQYQEEKNAHELTRLHLNQATSSLSKLQQDFDHQAHAMHNLQSQFNDCMFANATMNHLIHEKDQALQEALAHRDRVLDEMQQSIAKQQELTNQWEKAEQAAFLADSQRNFQFANHQLVLRKLTASVNDHLVTLERLHQAEEELMVLKSEFAEEIYEMKQNELRKKRQARALGLVAQSGLGATEPLSEEPNNNNNNNTRNMSSRGLSLKSLNSSHSIRSLSGPSPSTAPADAEGHRLLRVMRKNSGVGSPPRASTSGNGSPSRRSTSNGGGSRNSIVGNRPNYSLNAREYGKRVRAEEKVKHTNRLEKLELLRKEVVQVNEVIQNGVVSRGGTIAGIGIGIGDGAGASASMNAGPATGSIDEGVPKPLSPLEKDEKTTEQLRRHQQQTMQQEFVLSLKTFATHRKKQWQDFQVDRNKQQAFVKSVLQRPISTAPTLLPEQYTRRRSSDTTDDSSRISSCLPAVGARGEQPTLNKLLAPLGSSVPVEMEKPRSTLNFQVYRKYLPPQRPMTSPMELQMQQLSQVHPTEHDGKRSLAEPTSDQPANPSTALN